MRAEIPPTLQSEFSDWIVHLMVDVGFMEPQLGAVVALNSSIDTDRLVRAARLVMDAEPVLGCRFVPDDKRPFWERIENLDALPGISVIESDLPVRDGLSWLAEPLNPLDGPQMHVLICASALETVLTLKFSHVALDGAAMKQAVYTIASIYRELSEDPDYRPTPNLTGKRTVRAAAGQATLSQKLRALRPESPFPPTDWGMPRMPQTHADGGNVYVTRHLGRDSFRPIRDWGRQRGATVNDLVLAAYFGALVDVLEPNRGSATPIQLSCDYRRWMPEGTPMALGNISGTWCITDGLDQDASFEDTLRTVTEKTGAWKASDAGVQAALGITTAARLSYRTVAGEVTKQARQYTGEAGYPVLTNMGVLDKDKLDFGSTVPIADAFAVGPIGHPPGFVMCVSSFRDEMTISAGYDSSKLHETLAPRVLDGVVARLELLRAKN